VQGVEDGQESDVMTSSANVGLAMDPLAVYDTLPPFHPGCQYPELTGHFVTNGSGVNRVYDLVRTALLNLGLDQQRRGSPEWSPFRTVIRPGNRVVIFPNGVMHKNFNPSGGLFAVITHGAVIRPVVDYVYGALQGRGQIVIAHSPMNQCDFAEWARLSGCDSIAEFYRDVVGFKIDIVDLRTEFVPWEDRHGFAPAMGRKELSGDPLGYTEINLGEESAFHEWGERGCDNLYGADYDRKTTIAAHSDGRHLYRVANSILGADCIVCVPKLKTHSKVGVTLNLKAMVGTQGYKNFIPHCRLGSPSRRGDQYPECGFWQRLCHGLNNKAMDHWLAKKTIAGTVRYRLWSAVHGRLQSALNACYRIKYPGYGGAISGGNWFGNDTAWRMTLDLTRIVLCGRLDGGLEAHPQRQFISVVDGIVGGDKDGPVCPSPRQSGVVIAGVNPLAVDCVGARLMGFDPMRIAMLREAGRCRWLNGGTNEPLNPKVCMSDREGVSMNSLLRGSVLGYKPARGWVGRIEVPPAS
jgi:uncharacterized protein (DUF362 family)